MKTFPDFLFVELKRFGNDLKKNPKNISFPMDRVVLIDAQRYEIIGFINHHGASIGSGHYTAEIKNLHNGGKEQWIQCDDNSVKEVWFDELSDVYFLCLRKVIVKKDL